MPDPRSANRLAVACALVGLLAAAAPANAQLPSELVSASIRVGNPSGDGQRSGGPAVSQDAGFVAFWSEAADLVSGDRLEHRDVFRRDRSQASTTRVSIRPDGGEANADSPANAQSFPAISADGCVVVFSSRASNLVDGDGNGQEDVFVFDCSREGSERLQRISLRPGGAEALGASSSPDVSADGQRIVFVSSDPELVEGDTNGRGDVFLFDRGTGETVRVNVASDGTQADGSSDQPAISGDGNVIAFVSRAANLVPGANTQRQVYVRDLGGPETILISRSPTNAPGDGESFFPDLSFDGSLVVFKSSATTLTGSPDSNGVEDVFVHDLGAGRTERVSVDDFGNEVDDLSTGPSISADGRFVAFASFANQLVGSDGNPRGDVFVVDLERRRARQTPNIRLVDIGIGGVQPDGSVPDLPVSISANGRFVAFTSSSTNLIEFGRDVNGMLDDVFIACNPFDPVQCAPDTPTPTATVTPTPECIDDEDCPEGQVCVDNECVTPTPTATPTPECTEDEDCPEGQVCVDEMCVTPTATATPPGFCTDNDDCPPGQVCVDNRCVTTTPTATPTPVGFCTSDDDCPEGQVCVDNMCTDTTPTPTRTGTPTGGGGGGGGCSCEIDPAAPSGGGADVFIALMPLIVLVLRRRAHRFRG